MAPADKTAILNFSENKQSRTTEIKFGRPKVQKDHVIAVRTGRAGNE